MFWSPQCTEAPFFKEMWTLLFYLATRGNRVGEYRVVEHSNEWMICTHFHKAMSPLSVFVRPIHLKLEPYCLSRNCTSSLLQYADWLVACGLNIKRMWRHHTLFCQTLSVLIVCCITIKWSTTYSVLARSLLITHVKENGMRNIESWLVQDRVRPRICRVR
jgi:hypothetical protein